MTPLQATSDGGHILVEGLELGDCLDPAQLVHLRLSLGLARPHVVVVNVVLRHVLH